MVEEPFAPVRAVFTREASFPSYYESKRKPTLVVSIPHPGKIQLPEQLKSLRRENLSALFHSLSRHMKLTGRSLRPRRGRGPTKRAPRPPNVALSRRGQSATRHDTSHHRVSVERGCLALWSRIVPHLGRAKLNFKDRIPTRPAAPPHSGLPVRSRDSHRRGQEAACAVEGLGCRARSPLSPGPGPVPTAALTQQQQLDLPRRLLAVLPQVLVDHFRALGCRLVLGAHGAAHPAVRRPGLAPTRPTARLGPARPTPLPPPALCGKLSGPQFRATAGGAFPAAAHRRRGGPGVGPGRTKPATGPGRVWRRGRRKFRDGDWLEGGAKGEVRLSPALGAS